MKKFIDWWEKKQGLFGIFCFLILPVFKGFLLIPAALAFILDGDKEYIKIVLSIGTIDDTDKKSKRERNDDYFQGSL